MCVFILQKSGVQPNLVLLYNVCATSLRVLASSQLTADHLSTFLVHVPVKLLFSPIPHFHNRHYISCLMGIPVSLQCKKEKYLLVLIFISMVFVLCETWNCAMYGVNPIIHIILSKRSLWSYECHVFCRTTSRYSLVYGSDICCSI